MKTPTQLDPLHLLAIILLAFFLLTAAGVSHIAQHPTAAAVLATIGVALLVVTILLALIFGPDL